MGISSEHSTTGETPQPPTTRLSILCGMLLSAALIALMGCSPGGDGGASSSGSGASSAGSGAAVPGEIVVIRGEPIPPGASLEEVLNHPDPFERVQRVAQILQRSTPEDLEAIRYAFDNAPLPAGEVEYGLFGYWWASFDPEAAFVYADTHLRLEHGSVIVQVIRAWAHQDPIGALESSLLNNIDTQQPGIRDEFIDVLTASWFESGLPGLEAWMVSQENPRSIQTALRAYGMMHVLRDGPEAAIEFARNAPFEQQDRRLIIAGTLNVIAHEDPALAVRELESLEAEGLVDTMSFMPRIARSWSHHEPAKTLDWVLSLPESNDRSHALNRIARNWLRRDEASLAVWLQDHVGEEWTDTIRNQAVRWHVNKRHFQVDWETVMGRAYNLSDDRQAQVLAAWVLQRWMVADNAAAEEWVAANAERMDDGLIQRARRIAPHERAEIEEALSHKRMYSTEG